MAQQLQMTERCVTVWFQNRRAESDRQELVPNWIDASSLDVQFTERDIQNAVIKTLPSATRKRTVVATRPGNKFQHCTPEQFERIQVYYEEDPYPDRDRRFEIALELDMTYEKVSNWFQNQRCKRARLEQKQSPEAGTHSM